MKIDFGAACKDLFRTEGKWMTVLGLCVCMLIPIAGQMVGWGYLLRRYARVREGHPLEDFDFNLFGDYLKIGLWPLLAALVVSLVLVPVVFVMMIPMVFASIAGAEAENEALMIVVMIVSMLIYFVLILLVMVVTFPVMLRSGLMMDFKAGFRKSFVFGFVRRVGWSVLGYYFLLVLVSFPLMLVGYLALFVGVYVVAAWLQVAMLHLVFQHYDLYLERGGEKIDVHPDVIANLGPPPVPPRGGTARGLPDA